MKHLSLHPQITVFRLIPFTQFESCVSVNELVSLLGGLWGHVGGSLGREEIELNAMLCLTTQ